MCFDLKITYKYEIFFISLKKYDKYKKNEYFFHEVSNKFFREYQIHLYYTKLSLKRSHIQKMLLPNDK